LGKVFQILQCLIITLFCISLIGVSTVPIGNLHPSTNITEATIGKYYEACNHFHMVHEYGRHLRKMRSERLELVFEYTHSPDNKTTDWKEYEFIYKPGNKNFSGPFLGPYFSRLDQKFHGAMGSGAKLENNLWLSTMSRGLLRNNRDLLRVMSPNNLQIKAAPKFVRILFYRLKYLPKGSSIENGMYSRENLSEYLPPMASTSQELKDLVAASKITFKKEKIEYPALNNYLKLIRSYIERNLIGHIFIYSVFVAALIIIIVKRLFLKVF
jgi:hypothetical protein